MKIFQIQRCHIYLELDWNVSLVGVSWSGEPAARRDIGLFLEPLNMRIEKCDRCNAPAVDFSDATDE